MEQGKFRKRRNKFSQISNIAIQDETMSCQSRFLYCLISSYISIPDFSLYKSFIQKKASLGKDAFNKYWKELKDRGYLLQYELRDEKGHIYYEYELLDEPCIDNSAVGSGSGTNISQYSDNSPENSDSGLTGGGFSGYGKSDPNNNKLNNNDINNTNLNINNTNREKTKIINDFFYSVEAIVDETVQNNYLKNERLKKFFQSLNLDELTQLACMEKTDKVSFYCSILTLFDNNEIINKEGYLRTILKNPMSFVIAYENNVMANGLDAIS